MAADIFTKSICRPHKWSSARKNVNVDDGLVELESAVRRSRGLPDKDLGMVYVACGQDFSSVDEERARRSHCVSERPGMAQITGSSPLSTWSNVFSISQRYLSPLTIVDVGQTGEPTFNNVASRIQDLCTKYGQSTYADLPSLVDAYSRNAGAVAG